MTNYVCMYVLTGYSFTVERESRESRDLSCRSQAYEIQLVSKNLSVQIDDLKCNHDELGASLGLLYNNRFEFIEVRNEIGTV